MRLTTLPIGLLTFTLLSGCNTIPNQQGSLIDGNHYVQNNQIGAIANQNKITNNRISEVNETLSINSISTDNIQKNIINYKVPKDTQVQLVASDLAIEVGIDGVEWNNKLNPWSYKTLRTRTIDLSSTDKQRAYLALFSDTGLLARYDQDRNRVFVEPYKTKIKKTHNFEPSFTSAEINANNLSLNFDGLLSEENKEYFLYNNETLKDSLSKWAEDAGYMNVNWDITNPKQISILTKLNRANITVIERSPIHAIKAVLEKINNTKIAAPINMDVDETTKTLYFNDSKPNTVNLNMAETFITVD